MNTSNEFLFDWNGEVTSPTKRTKITYDFKITEEEVMGCELSEVDADIIIKNQKDCSNLLELIREVDKNIINISFAGGKYFVDNLNLSGEFNDKEINFYNASGENVEIFPASDVYRPEDSVTTTSTHYICELNSTYLGNNTLVADTGAVKICDSRNITNNKLYKNSIENIEIHDSVNKIYKVSAPGAVASLSDYNLDDFKSIFIWSAYLQFSNEIINIQDGLIYFKNTSYGFPNLDRDYLGIPARFYLSNFEEYLTESTFLVKDNKIYIPKSCKYAIVAKNNTCFNINNSQAKINFTGIKFSGGYINSSNMYQPIININNSRNVNINNCKFENTESQSIYIRSNGNGYADPYITKDIKITNCTFKNTGNGCVDFLGENIEITGCKFENIGEFRKGCEVVFGGGKNFYVADNLLENFPYVGLRVGKPGATRHYNIGTYENNVINGGLGKNPEEFMSDGGGIYVFTYNVDVLIKNNVIFNMTGRDMRGIMGDDGNNNTKYLSNLIFNINGTGASRGIDCINTLSNSTTNHQNNEFKNNIVIDNTIAFSSTDTSNTITETNIITQNPTYRGNGVIVAKKDHFINYFRTDDNFLYLANDTNLPIDIPEIFKDFIKFEDPLLTSTNRGNIPIFINNTESEINANNALVSNGFALKKYDYMNLNAQMIRSFSNSGYGLYSSLNIKIPWDLGVKTGDCFLNFKVNIYSERQTYRNSFEVTVNSYKPSINSYSNLLFEVSNVNQKLNTKDISLKVTGYIDESNYLALLLEPLIAGSDFFNSNLTFIELSDVKVNARLPLLTEKGEISINNSTSSAERILGTYAVLNGKVNSNTLRVPNVMYPENTNVFLSDTSQIAIRKNNKWYVQAVTEFN